MDVKKIFFSLMFLSLTCAASEPKFHYMDCVKVTHGFFKDCLGRIKTWDGTNIYSVDGDTCRGGTFYAEEKEENLKLATGCM